MEFFWKYLKEKSVVMAVKILMVAIFFITFWLYHLPLEAVIYPSLLCLVLEIFVTVCESSKYKKRHLQLSEFREKTICLATDLPKAESLLEEDYQALMQATERAHCELEQRANSSYHDMMEYYTVWVHQIKTPISSMKLSLQTEDTAVSRKLTSELFRIEQYVEMVLAYLRITSRSTDYLFRECDLDDVIRQCIKRFSTEFIEKKIALVYQPLNLKIITDEKWISFVVEQILSNALKYTKSGAIEIYISDNMELCIADSGIGIAPEDLPRIFENGYTGMTGRLDKTASGIGLYLCKTICNRLQRKIYATSTMGVGTVIHIDVMEHSRTLE